MKLLITIAALSLGSLITAFIPGEDKEELTIKPSASSVEWRAEKITGSHEGTVMLQSGKIILENNEIIKGHFIIDMTTIKVTDISGSSAAKLEGHLNSADFFNSEEFTTAKLDIESVTNKITEEFNSEITGNLTIKGIVHPITFPAKVEVKAGKFAAYGEIKIDRTKYDVKYGSANFFDNLGDRAIYDEFTLKVSIGASR
jgi:polyisoprenoid-binding protein YceI